MSAGTNPVNWFEIAVEDMNRAKSFYQAMLEVELSDQNMGPAEMAFFPFVENAAGCPGTLIKTEGYEPAPVGTIIYFHVSDIDATCARAVANGGEVIVPKMDIGEYGEIAQIRDTEGNRIGLHSAP